MHASIFPSHNRGVPRRLALQLLSKTLRIVHFRGVDFRVFRLHSLHSLQRLFFWLCILCILCSACLQRPGCVKPLDCSLQRYEQLALRRTLTSLRKESHARWSTAQCAGRVGRALATAVLFFSLPISADSRPSASMAGRTRTHRHVMCEQDHN